MERVVIPLPVCPSSLQQRPARAVLDMLAECCDYHQPLQWGARVILIPNVQHVLTTRQYATPRTVSMPESKPVMLQHAVLVLVAMSAYAWRGIRIIIWEITLPACFSAISNVLLRK